MVIIERLVQHVFPGKMAELDAIDKKYDVIEAKMGFPPKKRLQMISGPDEMSTLIVERQWVSLAAMEAAYEKLMVNPEWQALYQGSDTILRDSRMELYMPLP